MTTFPFSLVYDEKLLKSFVELWAREYYKMDEGNLILVSYQTTCPTYKFISNKPDLESVTFLITKKHYNINGSPRFIYYLQDKWIRPWISYRDPNTNKLWWFNSYTQDAHWD